MTTLDSKVQLSARCLAYILWPFVLARSPAQTGRANCEDNDGQLGGVGLARLGRGQPR